MVQYLSYELTNMKCMRLKQEVVIKGKTDGHARGPLNIEQPIVVQKKKLKKNRNYGVSYHLFRVLINKKKMELMLLLMS